MAISHLEYTDRILDGLTECLTADVAERIIALRAEPDLQRRIETLADKSTVGTLSREERIEYESYVRAIDLVTLLQSRSRRFLKLHAPSE